MDELRPCPFCGSKHVSMMHPDDEYTGAEINNEFFIVCADCAMETGVYFSASTLKKLWNRRFEADGAK